MVPRLLSQLTLDVSLAVRVNAVAGESTVVTLEVTVQNGLSVCVTRTVKLPAGIPETNSGFVDVLAATMPFIETPELSKTS